MKDSIIRPVAEEIHKVRCEKNIPAEPDTDWYAAIEYLKYWTFMPVRTYAEMMFENKLHRKVSPLLKNGGY